MESTNDTTENQDLVCYFCAKAVKNLAGKSAHERACKQNPENQETKEAPVKALTPEEAAIVSRVDSEDTDWFTISEESITDFSLMADPLLLPPIAQKFQNERIYAFRWCERTAKRVDQLCKSQQPPLRWAIVNKSTLPQLSKEVDDILGCVCRLDQLLLFKPWAHHAMVKKAKEALADNLDRAGQLESREAKSDESYQYLAGKDHKIKSGDDIHFDEAAFDASMGETTDTAGLGDLVVNE